ncbi:hypothetical protein FGLOB1_5400 [Fusarium globosum]|uniref:Uncharacterized protein n=1 Tax=Fusarium globosum TaxID=78864 RepID=A0A8H5YEG9_9HYPO|nr:hypothetical protein FGLOB1_5400 [Fusarium globosum]
MDQPILTLTPSHHDVGPVWNALRRCLSKRLNAADVAFLELFSRILIGRDNCSDEISRALEKGIELECLWTFDLDKDVLFLTKHDWLFFVPLRLARERILTLDDFETLKVATETTAEENVVPGPYWDLQPKVDHREKAFLGRIFRDFGHTWRHVLRAQMNNITFTKLAFAIIWILNLDFTVVERTGFEHVGGRGGPYVGVADLPRWDASDGTIVRVGTCWILLARDIAKGLEMIREHMEDHEAIADIATGTPRYGILTLKHILCCSVHDGELVYTRPEPLFGNIPLSDSAIYLLLWASDLHQAEPRPCRLNHLPIEIQNRILRQASISNVAAAKLGIELALGSPFSWAEQGRTIKLAEVLRHRTEASPVESQFFFDGLMSGLSYKCEAMPDGFNVDMSSLPAPPHHNGAVPLP